MHVFFLLTVCFFSLFVSGNDESSDASLKPQEYNFSTDQGILHRHHAAADVCYTAEGALVKEHARHRVRSVEPVPCFTKKANVVHPCFRPLVKTGSLFTVKDIQPLYHDKYTIFLRVLII